MLAGSLPAFEMFMTTWELLGDNHPRLKPFIDIGLEWARKYYCRMDLTRAYIVAMGMFCFQSLLSFTDCNWELVINPCVRMSWIRKHWESEYILKAEDIVKDLVRYLYISCSSTDVIVTVDRISCNVTICGCSTENQSET